MSYLHDGRKPVRFRKDPADPDLLKDEVFFALDPWLREGLLEELDPLSLSAFAEGTEIIEQPRSVGPMLDSGGTLYQHVYAVAFGPINEGAAEVKITFRKSTETTAIVGLGRTDHDHTVIIPVGHL
jgi:hypothetical protein